MDKKPKTKVDEAMENASEEARKIANQAAAAGGGVPGNIVSSANPEIERETYKAGQDRNPLGPGEDEIEVVTPKKK
jgi:F0F1-type ATP synthase membrane subunit b/b'